MKLLRHWLAHSHQRNLFTARLSWTYLASHLTHGSQNLALKVQIYKYVPPSNVYDEPFHNLKSTQKLFRFHGSKKFEVQGNYRGTDLLFNTKRTCFTTRLSWTYLASHLTHSYQHLTPKVQIYQVCPTFKHLRWTFT